jgi:hypothetical protein
MILGYNCDEDEPEDDDQSQQQQSDDFSDLDEADGMSNDSLDEIIEEKQEEVTPKKPEPPKEDMITSIINPKRIDEPKMMDQTQESLMNQP